MKCQSSYHFSCTVILHGDIAGSDCIIRTQYGHFEDQPKHAQDAHYIMALNCFIIFVISEHAIGYVIFFSLLSAAKLTA